MSTIENTRTDNAPFGWYPDPAGSHKLRFWSGTEWTDKLASVTSEVQPRYVYSDDGRITQRFTY